MIKMAVCDDIKQDMDKMAEYIVRVEKKLELEEDIEITHYMSGEDIVEAVVKKLKKYDIIMMDVQLGGITGKAAAEEIRKMDSDVIICIMSRDEQPVPADFRLNAYRYIMKDESEEVIMQDIESIILKSVQMKNNGYMFFTEGEDNIRVKLDDIMYVSKIKRGSELHMKKDEKLIKIKEKMTDIEEKLGENGFGYAHNSYMVNYRAVTAFIEHGNAVRLENGEALNVSRKYKEAFIKGHMTANHMK